MLAQAKHNEPPVYTKGFTFVNPLIEGSSYESEAINFKSKRYVLEGKNIKDEDKGKVGQR